MKTILTILILASLAIAQDPPKTTTPPPAPKKVIPVIPGDYMSKLQALEIQQKDIVSDEERLGNQYKSDVQKMQDASKKANDLEQEMFKKLGLDPGKYQVNTTVDGYLEIVEKTPAVKK
jgi:hypothetical protein